MILNKLGGIDMKTKDKAITIAAVLILFFFNMTVMIYNGLATEIAMLLSVLIIGFTFIVLWFTGNWKLGIQ